MVLNELMREKMRLGRYSEKVSLVRMSRGRFSADEQATVYFIDLKTVRAILDTIDAHPDWDDEQVAENIAFD